MSGFAGTDSDQVIASQPLDHEQTFSGLACRSLNHELLRDELDYIRFAEASAPFL